MLSAIQLDRQFRCGEREIHNKHPNRVLAPKPDRDSKFA